MKLSVYQIGVGDFGKYGFEKLVELHNNFDMVDVELKAICDSDFDHAERAEKFAAANDIEIQVFTDIEELYREAEKDENPVMIYDSGPTESHANNIYRSLHRGFYHLAEKPPSMNRDQHLKEKQLAKESKVMWKVDFIERENPVVRKAVDLLEGEELDELQVFRQSSAGIEKMLDPVSRAGVKGGDILDKMVHEVYVLDMIEAAQGDMELDLVEARADYFLPKKQGSEKFMSIQGGYTEEINYDTATAMSEADFVSGETSVKLSSSWVGGSNSARLAAQKVRKKTGHSVFNSDYSELNDRAYSNEECRFFITKGTRALAGDMLNQKLFDLETGDELELDEYLHDQLYRVIEKAVLNAAGEKSSVISDKEIDVFMNAIFDVKEEIADKDHSFLDVLEESNQKVNNMIVEDRKVLETEKSESVAG